MIFQIFILYLKMYYIGYFVLLSVFIQLTDKISDMD